MPKRSSPKISTNQTRSIFSFPFSLLLSSSPVLGETHTHNNMARLTFFSSALLLLVIAAVAAGSSFDESNPIQMVSDGLREFESHVLQVVGNTRHALRFARFATKYCLLSFQLSVFRSLEFLDWSLFFIYLFFIFIGKVWEEVRDCGGDEAPIRDILRESEVDQVH